MIGFLPGVPDVSLDPDLVLLIFLPPLLYGAAFFTSVRDLRRNAKPIALLSIPLVLRDDGSGGPGRALGDRTGLGPGVRARRHRVAHRRRGARRDHAAHRGAAAPDQHRRGREPDERLDGARALPVRRRGGRHGLVLARRGGPEVPPHRRGRRGHRPDRRSDHPRDPRPPRRPAHRDHHLDPVGLRGVPPGGGAGPVGRDRRGHGGPLHGLAHARAHHARDAPPGPGGLGDPDVPPERGAVPARGPAAPRGDGPAVGTLGRRAGRLGAARERGGDRRAAPVDVPRPVRGGDDRPPRERGGPATRSTRGAAGHRLGGHARVGVAGRRTRHPDHDRRGRAVPGPRADHVPHLRRDPRDADRPGTHARPPDHGPRAPGRRCRGVRGAGRQAARGRGGARPDRRAGRPGAGSAATASSAPAISSTTGAGASERWWTGTATATRSAPVPGGG